MEWWSEKAWFPSSGHFHLPSNVVPTECSLVVPAKNNDIDFALGGQAVTP